jgi:GTP-binding protein
MSHKLSGFVPSGHLSLPKTIVCPNSSFWHRSTSFGRPGWRPVSFRQLPRSARHTLQVRALRAQAERTTSAVPEAIARASAALKTRNDVINIAICAHVDHGKTTLVDAILHHAKVFRENQTVSSLVMDSNELERERGITILSKNTAVVYGGVRINVIDTPGHADFGGEVQRVLSMADAMLLVVDSVEGPRPQTRYVLREALRLGQRVLVVVNKIDRPAARPVFVVNKTFDLFVELGASDEQADFPVVYASALKRVAGYAPDQLANDMGPLFEEILRLPRPRVALDAPLQLLVSNISSDDYKGILGIGRIHAGTLRKGATVRVGTPAKDEAELRTARVDEVFLFENLGRVSAESAHAGDIVMVAGVDDIRIGETICDAADPRLLPPVQIEEPTVRMSLAINTTPFAGREGRFLTSRQLRERLERETRTNVALRIQDGEKADSFTICGRGALHLTILIESMRREGFEMIVGAPEVIFKMDPETNTPLEPFDHVEVQIPEEYLGAVVDALAKRRGEMLNLTHSQDNEQYSIVEYIVPTRGLFGLNNALLTLTRGTAIIHTSFAAYRPYVGQVRLREVGSLLAHETGRVTTYGVEAAQERGQLFVAPGAEVYENQIVGENKYPEDLRVNVCRVKQLTNHRSATKEVVKTLQGIRTLTLDDALEYISGENEFVEVTPQSIRMFKVLSKRRSIVGAKN